MHRSQAFWGALLVIIGGLFLLNTLDVVSFNVWSTIWPLMLILFGIWILVNYRTGGSWWPGFDDAHAEHLNIPADGAETAHIRVGGIAGRVQVGAGPDEQAALLTGKFSGGVRHSVKHEGAAVRVRLKAPEWWGGGHWQVGLKRDMPISIRVDGGAGEIDLDLNDLHITDLDCEGRVGPLTVRMPANVGLCTAKIEGSVGAISIYVPEGVAARIKVDEGLGDRRIDSSRFPHNGKYYQSPDYETAERKLDLKLDHGVGSMIVG